jgi:hypothetical protein
VKDIYSYINEAPEMASDYSSHSVPSSNQGTSQTPDGLPGSYVPNDFKFQEDLKPSENWHHGNWGDFIEKKRFLTKGSIKEKGKSEK